MKIRLSDNIIYSEKYIVNPIYNIEVRLNIKKDIFLEMFKNPIEIDEIEKLDENIKKFIEDLCSSGILVPEDKDIELVSVRYLLNNSSNSMFGTPKGILDNCNEHFGFFGIPYYSGSNINTGNIFAIDNLRQYTAKNYNIQLKENEKTVGWFNLNSKKNVFVNKHIYDYGDLLLSCNQRINLCRISNLVSEILKLKVKPIFIGGDHSITTQIIKEYSKAHEKIQIIYIDAHDDIGVNRWNICEHGSVVSDLLKNKKISKIIQLGLRGPQEISKYDSRIKRGDVRNINDVTLEIEKNVPTYLSIDLDVLDTSIFPSVNYRIPGGWSYNDFIDVIYKVLNKINIIGIDLVEYNGKNGIEDISLSTLAYLILEILSIVGDENGYNK